MDASSGFCLAALEEALARFGKPETFNTDQSLPRRKSGAANSPAAASLACWRRPASRISMDGRGRWIDNVFIERLWRSLRG